MKRARRILGCEVALLEEHPPALAGVSEVATILGWDRRKVAVYAERGRLPEPVAELAGGRIWRQADIEVFKGQEERRVGRPDRAGAEARARR